MSEKIDELVKNLNVMAKGHVKTQTVWAVVKSVDWDDKTMVATGVRDDLDFNNVLLGIGSYYIKPAIGSKCLLGLVENIDAASYLIQAESADLIEYNGKVISLTGTDEVNIDSAQVTINGGENGGLVIVQSLVDRINLLESIK